MLFQLSRNRAPLDQHLISFFNGRRLAFGCGEWGFDLGIQAGVPDLTEFEPRSQLRGVEPAPKINVFHVGIVSLLEETYQQLLSNWM
jgi:hypothetical protein